MFIAEEAYLAVGFPAARARLEKLAQGSGLACASRAAYGGAPEASGLVSVCVVDLVVRDDSVTLGVRWNAAGPGGALFPALDANIVLTADGGRATVLRLVGAYRAAQDAPDSPITDRVTATIRRFVGGLADAIVCPAGRAGPAGPGLAGG
jgi:hypothetical protein